MKPIHTNFAHVRVMHIQIQIYLGVEVNKARVNRIYTCLTYLLTKFIL
jgi:hypothetical protein